MPHFRYKARSMHGEPLVGLVEATTADAVASQLINSGITPIEINAAAAPAKTSLSALWSRRRVTLDDLIMFARQLHALVKAGVPIIRGLRGLLESGRSQALREALVDVLNNLEAGHDLGGSLARHPTVFSPIVIATIRVGESTGRLDWALLQLGRYLQQEKDTRDRIRGALRYPAMVITAIAVAIAVINIWVVPAFAGVFARAGAELPWATRVLVGTSNFMVAYWPALLVCLVGLVAGTRLYVGTERGRYRWSRFKLRLPVVGSIVHRATLARFARGVALSLRSGVPLDQALTVVARAVDNDFIAEHILGMRNAIERGDTLSRTAAATGQFTPLVLQMLAVGEETGELENLLDEMAEFYEREVDYEVKNLSSAIEPILLVAIGVMVLVLALGVFLPMWDLSTSVFK